MTDKKFFTVACSWEVYATIDIEAESLVEAIDIAQYDSPLPNEPSYIEDSFRIDYEGTDTYNGRTKPRITHGNETRGETETDAQ